MPRISDLSNTTNIAHKDDLFVFVADAMSETFSGKAPGIGTHTIWVPATAMVPRTTNGASVGTMETASHRIMMNTLNFDPTTVEYAQFWIALPESAGHSAPWYWNPSTPEIVKVQFVWSHPATTTNFDVIWGIDANTLRNNFTIDSAFSLGPNRIGLGGNTDTLYVTTVTDRFSVGSNFSIGANDNIVVFQVYRNATHGSDTLAVDARLHGVKIFYETFKSSDDPINWN